VITLNQLKQRFQSASRRGTFFRRAIQWSVLLWCLFAGVRFGLFVSGFGDGGVPVFSRHPSVEGFLPIGALISLRHWINTGVVHSFHPAALVLFVTFLVMSLIGKKSFCSFVCPVGTVSERLWRGGKSAFGRNWRIWTYLDIPLKGAKYLLLYFFINITFLKMPARALGSFLDSSYWAIADVKMLFYFTRMSALVMGVLAALVLLSVIYKNFWCRYLCPYGALVGILSLASPWKIRRNEEHCIECGVCGRGCPFHLPVDRKKVIRSVECTGCLTCVSNCSAEGVLYMTLPLLKHPLPPWVYPAFVMAVFTMGIGWGMVSGHWQTSLTIDDYRTLIPIAMRIGH
jgi:polyferredoxin